jgi:hypothetical protein
MPDQPPRWVLHSALPVICHRFAFPRGEHAARFFHQQLAGGEVPVPFGPHGDHCVGFAFRQQGQAQGGGIHGAGFRPQGAQIAQPPRIADQLRAINLGMAGDVDRPAVLARAAALDRVVHDVRAGIIDRRGDGLAVLDHGAGHDELGPVFQKRAGAVDRVHQKSCDGRTGAIGRRRFPPTASHSRAGPV